MPAAGTYSIVNYVREGPRGPFKAKKAKKFLPVAATFKSLWKEMCLFVATPLWGRGGESPLSS